MQIFLGFITSLIFSCHPTNSVISTQRITKHHPKPVVWTHDLSIHHQTFDGKALLLSCQLSKTNTLHNTTAIDDMSKSGVIYSGIVVDVLLEIFIFGEDRFGDEMIVLDTDNWNQWSWVNICQPCNLLRFLIILQ